MDTLVLKNNGSSPLKIYDLGIEILSGEELDLIPGFKNEEIIESQDFLSLYAQDGQVTLTSGINTYIMTYQDVINYLTPLSKWDKLDYEYISNKDLVSDITSQELEELTNGSDTLLHNHDNRYYTQEELQTPGSSQVHYENIIGSTDTETVISNGDVYFKDPIRGNKWLSITEQQYLWSESVIDGKYMSVGEVSSSNAGYLVPQNFTLTKITVSSSGHPTKELQIRVNNNSVHTFNLSGGIYNTASLNIDVFSGDIIKIFVSGAGNPITDVIVVIYGKWRM